MQINFKIMSVITLALFISVTSCKKETVSNETSTEMTAHSEDQSTVSNNMDAIANDVNAAIESTIDFSGRTSNINSICSASIDVDTFSNPRTITIHYAGANCFGSHSREGSVVLSMSAGTRWKDVGAILTVTYQNLKITRLIDNKSITLNGTQTFTNVTGGLLINLPNMSSIIHTINSRDMSIKFDNNTMRTWNIARKRTYTYNNGVVISVTGTYADGTNTNIAEWGSNRAGHAFMTSITQPLVFRQDCEFRLTSGQVKHHGFGTATVTFGLNANGVATTCPGAGHYYYSLVWTGMNGNTQTVIHRY